VPDTTDVAYAEIVRKARDAVQDLQEPLRSVAFGKVLDDLILQARVANRMAPPVQSVKMGISSGPGTGGDSAIDLFLSRSIDASAYGGLFASRGRLLDKSLAVLKLGRDEFGLESLAASEIADVLTKKFRVASIRKSNVSRDLGRAPQFVSRTKDPSGFLRYSLTLPGEARLSKTLKDFA